MIILFSSRWRWCSPLAWKQRCQQLRPKILENPEKIKLTSKNQADLKKSSWPQKIPVDSKWAEKAIFHSSFRRKNPTGRSKIRDIQDKSLLLATSFGCFEDPQKVHLSLLIFLSSLLPILRPQLFYFCGASCQWPWEKISRKKSKHVRGGE